MSAPTAAIKALQNQRYWLLNALERETERVSSLAKTIEQVSTTIAEIGSDLVSVDAAIVTLGGTLEAEVRS